MSDINIGALSEAINDKMDRDLNNRSDDSGLRKLVESYVNGTEWYKIFDEIQSDGTVKKWCEQGGLTTAPSSTSCSATLLKPYIDTNYFVTVMGRARSGWLGITSQTTTGFTCRIEDGGGVGSWWFACGYIS